jgi:hypothetical protein
MWDMLGEELRNMWSRRLLPVYLRGVVQQGVAGLAEYGATYSTTHPTTSPLKVLTTDETQTS